MTRRYRVIDAPGYGFNRSNKVEVHATSDDLRSLYPAFRHRSKLVQESLSGGFNTDESWDWMDAAHRGQITAGLVRNVTAEDFGRL